MDVYYISQLVEVGGEGDGTHLTWINYLLVIDLDAFHSIPVYHVRTNFIVMFAKC